MKLRGAQTVAHGAVEKVLLNFTQHTTNNNYNNNDKECAEDFLPGLGEI